MNKIKTVVEARSFVDGIPRRVWEEKRMVYFRNDGSMYVNVMKNPKPVKIDPYTQGYYYETHAWSVPKV